MKPGAPCLLPIGSTLSIIHAAGSASAVGHTLARALTLPSAVFSTRSFRRYHVSAFHANGFLTVSMLSRLLNDSIDFGPARMGVNYGFNRLRFTGPVPAGSRLRGRFTLNNLEEIEGGVQATWGVIVEREGSEKPCLVAEWLTRRYD